VDGANRRISSGDLATTLAQVRAAYRAVPEHLRFEADEKPADSASRWLLGRLGMGGQ
jgi:hypothetical protein